jgi:hypothetical protein
LRELFVYLFCCFLSHFQFLKNCTLGIIFQPWLQINFCLLIVLLSAVSYCHHLKLIFSYTMFTVHSLSQVVWLNLGNLLVYSYDCGTLQPVQNFMSDLTSCTCMSCSVGFIRFEYCCKNKYCVK